MNDLEEQIIELLRNIDRTERREQFKSNVLILELFIRFITNDKDMRVIKYFPAQGEEYDKVQVLSGDGRELMILLP